MPCLAEDETFVPSAHTGQVTPACNSSPQDLPADNFTHAHMLQPSRIHNFFFKRGLGFRSGYFWNKSTQSFPSPEERGVQTLCFNGELHLVLSITLWRTQKWVLPPHGTSRQARCSSYEAEFLLHKCEPTGNRSSEKRATSCTEPL